MNTRQALAALAFATLTLGAQAVGHRADVTIVDRSSGRELPIFWHEGRPYVAGNPGNEYQVTVRNRRGEDLLAVISVDGVNAVTGKTANTAQSGYVLSPGQRLDLRGWRKSMDETAAFYFTSLANSYAGRTGRPDNVGVIGVALFERARPAVYSPPPDESSSPWDARREKSAQDSGSMESKRNMPASPAASAAPLGTGHGRREESHITSTTFERASDDPVETVAIYYDSYRNLVAQGVIPVYGHRRDPKPFPSGFTPDP